MRRTIALTVLALLASLTCGLAAAQDVSVKTAQPAADVNVGNAETLTAEQARNLKPMPGGLHFGKLTELSPEVAAILANLETELEFNALTSLSLETAKALASHQGLLRLGKVEKLSDASAAALAAHRGPLDLRGLTSLDSLPLATKLGQQEKVNLERVATISVEIADALCPASIRENRGAYGILIGLEELSVEVARTFSLGRGVVMLPSLPAISDEAAAVFSNHRGKLALSGLKQLSPAAAKSLSSGPGLLVLTGLTEISDDAAASLASGEMHPDLQGLTKRTSVPLAIRLIQVSGPHTGLTKVATVSDEVAQALVRHSGKQLPLPGLTSLTHAPLAKKLATLHEDLKLAKLTTVSDEVAQSLATHKGKLDLSGLTTLSDGAAQALSQHEGELILTGLETLSDPSAALLRGNDKIQLPRKFQAAQPKAQFEMPHEQDNRK